MVYQNPIAKNGDFADPFVLKYNGRYYLYCTNEDIRCWSSDDLLHWHPEGAVIEDTLFPGLTPFAPEVVYWNGSFYLYTSPSGFGHYVLKSENPTGPFRKISGNVGHEIDGTIFIDDDGTWYFYWAGEEGIWGCEMKSPAEFGEPVLTGAYLHGWTEGPFVCKKDGIYYMTYTGNHYLSKGYRIHACRSKTPLSGYLDDKNNPVVIRTEGRLTGLGHSSTVEGPDLVSDYLIYHNLNADTTRDLNIDRQLWYQEVTQIAGPTQMEQCPPAMPDYVLLGRGNDLPEFVCRSGEMLHTEEGIASGEEGMLALSRQLFAKSFTAECNIRIKSVEPDRRTGIVLEADDECLRIVFASGLNAMQLWRRCGKEERLIGQSDLLRGYDFTALHCIRICRNPDGCLEVYLDRRRQITLEMEKRKAYRIGYTAPGSGLEIGYTAVTESTWKERTDSAVIPAECAFYPVFGKVDGERKADGSVVLRQGESAQYSIWAGEEGVYRCVITMHRQKPGKTEILLDGMEVCACEKDDADLSFFERKMDRGMHGFSVVNQSGIVRIDKIRFYPCTQWTDYQNELTGAELDGYGKRLSGNTAWSDYTVSAALSAECGENGNAGILLRVTEPSEGGEGADPVLGIDFFIGYSVSFTGKELMVIRHRYDETILGRCAFHIEAGEVHRFRVEVSGASIRVYTDGEKEPGLIVTDDSPVENGCAVSSGISKAAVCEDGMDDFERSMGFFI